MSLLATAGSLPQGEYAMPTNGSHDELMVDHQAEQNDWLESLTKLTEDVLTWAEGLDWSCRRIEVNIQDSKAGVYRAPGLVMQKDSVKLRLEPVSGNVVGADGVVDLYVLPAYDDLASLSLKNGVWRLNYLWQESPPPTGQFALRDVPSEPLTRESFSKVVEQMVRYAGAH